ncbi:alpha/beta hydrolase [Saccharopolyspora gloriosae]|uniref:lipase family alpha/beta hydrolase n=1 Tax=Saccharopolyspora gloriosae TaxID=455344 RepID=UPI001FB6AB9D|nr:alpha/beta hydrolase [Saccharopolyspora gloriosae]
MFNKSSRFIAVMSTTSLIALAGPALSAQAAGTEAEKGAKDLPVYFVHGYGYEDVDGDGNKDKGKNCSKTWGPALDYFKDHGWDEKQLITVGYYPDDKCDVDINPADENDATRDTKIQYIAQDLAAYIKKKHGDEPVNIVAHSMGGLITRTAMFGHEHWGEQNFPKINVDQIVTLGTPHNGVICEDKDDPKDSCNNGTTQWQQMNPDSKFIDVLHDYKLTDDWAKSTDWSFVGSNQDETVNGNSAIDLGHHADHKYRYWDSNRTPANDACNEPERQVTHCGIRTLKNNGENPDGDPGDDDGDYDLNYWNADDGKRHETRSGWAPVKAAALAISRGDDA